MIATINPHFKLNKEDYYDFDDEELLIMVKEFEEYQQKVRDDINKSKREAQQRR